MTRFYPRNRKSRHDALIGPNHVSGHPRADELTRRDRLHRYERGNDLSFVVTGTVAAVAQTAFQAGGTLVYTCAGDDRFKFDAVTVRFAALIAAFAALTGTTLIAGSFALSSDGLVLTVTVPVNLSVTGAYVVSFSKDLFANAHDAVVSTLTIS